MVDDMDHHQTSPTRGDRGPSGRSRLRVTGFGVAVLALGLLLWARFLIVTNYQRTALAEPARMQGRPGPAAAPPAARPADRTGR